MVSIHNLKAEDAVARERREMVEKQLLTRGISDKKVLDAMGRVPRHLFVIDEFRHKAYADCPLPIGEKQTISQPYMVAIMTQLLELKGSEKILEIGTGSGYQTAILGLLAEKVYSVERIQKLQIRARGVLEKLGYANIGLKVFDGTLGWSEFAPYDAILVTAGSPETPKALLDQLRVGGRLVIPTGNDKKQVLKKIIKTPSGFRESSYDECTFVKLIGLNGWQEEV
ncbi:MAG: protein-L-isoaspartate(D-aspartate) O-methyltransferase [Nitrospinota bacterium]|nr:protein-L-isoaspartate(D-aspartate) O-methyltransferase [Nitrospinota bacterium]